MDKTPQTNRPGRPSRDPVLTALQRLLTATDRSIAATDKVREARVALAKQLEGSRGK